MPNKLGCANDSRVNFRVSSSTFSDLPPFSTRGTSFYTSLIFPLRCGLPRLQPRVRRGPSRVHTVSLRRGEIAGRTLIRPGQA
jgi:hypothetical protein